MNGQSSEIDFSLIPAPGRELATSQAAQNRILSEMVDNSLALARDSVVALVNLDACLRKLCIAFREKCPAPDVAPLQSELDDLSLACLLVAEELGAGAAAETLAELKACLQKVAGRFWGDRLPWQLALEFCDGEAFSVAEQLEELTANLDHSNSNIRCWMFDLAWCVRDRINPVEASLRLLKNVADTLGYWDFSLGLCRTLLNTDECFWAMADDFQPKDLADQYQERMDFAREKGLLVFQQCFEPLELRLRHLISESALGLAPEESNMPADLDGLVREGESLYLSNGKGMTEENIRAFELFRCAAEGGRAEAQTYLGYCYQTGNGVERNSVEAAKWYRKAAEQGNAAGQFSLGWCYRQGEGLSQDIGESVRWNRKAAEQGNANAQLWIASCASTSDDHGDRVQAAMWYRRAAEQGNRFAQYHLGCHCRDGDGIPRDILQAYMWFRLAADQDHAAATQSVATLVAMMSPSEFEAADALYREFEDKNDASL